MEIDYYVVTRTRYSGSDVVTEELVAEDTSLEIVGFDESDRESYSVQSVRLDVRSPMSNVGLAGTPGVTIATVGQDYDQALSEGVYFIVTDQHRTPVRVYVQP